MASLAKGNKGAAQPLLVPSYKEQKQLPSNRATDLLDRTTSFPDDELKFFRRWLKWICMDQSSWYGTLISWLLFLLLAVAIPTFSHLVLLYRPQRRPFSAVVQLSLTAASAASFVLLAVYFRRIGLGRFLFLDKMNSKSDRVREGYALALASSFRLIALFVSPCFAAQAAYKVWWYAISTDRVPFIASPLISDVVMFTLELASWMYRTVIFFLTCVLFRLICHLQGLRLEEFVGAKLNEVAEGRADFDTVLLEHLDIRKQLQKISHRFRGFIIACMLIVTASQFTSLLLTTKHDSVDDFFNTTELVICSVVLVVGLAIILSSAAKITHQAHALIGQTAKWHACCTIEMTDTSTTSTETLAGIAPSPYLAHQENENDVEPFNDDTVDEDILESTKMVIPTLNVISFQKRQSLVTYLENNHAGITLFGFNLNRSYLQTIFMLEWTLFLWLLSKTIGI